MRKYGTLTLLMLVLSYSYSNVISFSADIAKRELNIFQIHHIILLIALVKEPGGIELLVYNVELINEQDSKEIFLRLNKQTCLFIRYVKSTLQ